jgi:hypothetical protein
MLQHFRGTDHLNCQGQWTDLGRCREVIWRKNFYMVTQDDMRYWPTTATEGRKGDRNVQRMKKNHSWNHTSHWFGRILSPLPTLHRRNWPKYLRPSSLTETFPLYCIGIHTNQSSHPEDRCSMFCQNIKTFNTLSPSPLAFHWIQKPGHFWHVF